MYRPWWVVSHKYKLFLQQRTIHNCNFDMGVHNVPAHSQNRRHGPAILTRLLPPARCPHTDTLIRHMERRLHFGTKQIIREMPWNPLKNNTENIVLVEKCALENNWKYGTLNGWIMLVFFGGVDAGFLLGILSYTSEVTGVGTMARITTGIIELFLAIPSF